MVTVAHLTKKLLEEKPFIHEALENGIINIVALAEMLRPDIEKEMGRVKTSAIAMAIRRETGQYRRFSAAYSSLITRTDLLIKSNLFELSIQKSNTLFPKLQKLYAVVDFEEGDTLNIIHGNYEVLILSNERYLQAFKKIMGNERIKKARRGISSLSMKIPGPCIDQPGFYFTVTKLLALENISIIDLVNTQSEATLILDDKDIGKAYNLLKREMKIGRQRTMNTRS
ncbi:MAG: hypothetical protein GXP63_05100 [DPANN group archaeon]|nr:hypothetical protein [DPANN group archaeon]